MIPYPTPDVRRSPREIRVGLDVTVIAPHAQGYGDEIHQRKKLRLRKRLQHLELWPLLTGRTGLLRRGCNGEAYYPQNVPMTGHVRV